MKKFLALLMTMAMVLSLAACGGSKEEAPAQTNEPAAAEEPAEPAITTVTEGKLTVATSPDFAPYEFYAIDESGNAQLGSIQYDLAEENTPDADIVQLAKVTDVVSELLGGKLDAGYIETVVAESYAKNYPDLYIAFDVPYEVEGSAVGVVKGNEALLAGVNEAIAAALADGSMDDFVVQANEQASGEIIEGLVD